jgi:CheY-like chemotaxis protein
LVAGMADLLTRSIDSNVELERRFPLKLAAVLADANQLELALLNLVVNARDAMPHGGSIVIAAKEATIEDPALSGRFVCLSVTDTGEGMDAETLARATEPFFTTKGIGKGTGLGLPMVHGVAQQSGGRLVLRSQKGQGTTAQLWLPCAPSTAVAALATAPNPKPEADIRPQVVLLVDDDTLVLHSAAAMLEDLGHRVLPATSAEQALNLLAQHPEVEVLVTDHAMPGMTGAELAEAVRKTSPIPIVLATGYAELPLDFAANVTRLAKPFSQSELQHAVADALPRTQPE